MSITGGSNQSPRVSEVAAPAPVHADGTGGAEEAIVGANGGSFRWCVAWSSPSRGRRPLVAASIIVTAAATAAAAAAAAADMCTAAATIAVSAIAPPASLPQPDPCSARDMF